MENTQRIYDVELIGAKEAGRLLGINANAVYALWNNKQLTWWCINGTKKTTRQAIGEFLEKTQFVELREG